MEHRFKFVLISFVFGGACTLEENHVPPGPPPGSADCLPQNQSSLADPNLFVPCAENARCIPESFIALFDPDQVERFSVCPNDATGRCVPDSIVRQGLRYVPPTCLAYGTIEGRCLAAVLPEVESVKNILEPSTCAGGELCSPCYHPITGEDTGACSITSCDPGPASGQQGFASCGQDRGRCIPGMLIPTEHAGKLMPVDCQMPTDRCVSNRILQNGPYETCSGVIGGFVTYSGTCLNRELLNLEYLGVGIGSVLAQATCRAPDVCVPCYNFGTPTHAPGCPGVSPVL
jgi:hypothetical protein